MDQERLLDILDEMNLPYMITSSPEGDDRIYVYDRVAYNTKQKNPDKSKDLYVSYCRISFEPGGMIYVRDNGWCRYVNDDQLIQILNELAAN